MRSISSINALNRRTVHYVLHIFHIHPPPPTPPYGKHFRSPIFPCCRGDRTRTPRPLMRLLASEAKALTTELPCTLNQAVTYSRVLITPKCNRAGHIPVTMCGCKLRFVNCELRVYCDLSFASSLLRFVNSLLRVAICNLRGICCKLRDICCDFDLRVLCSEGARKLSVQGTLNNN